MTTSRKKDKMLLVLAVVVAFALGVADKIDAEQGINMNFINIDMQDISANSINITGPASQSMYFSDATLKGCSLDTTAEGWVTCGVASNITDTNCTVANSCSAITYDSELTYTTSLPMANITNLISSYVCTGTNKLTNVTINSTGIFGVCSADADTDTIITTLPATNITGLTYTTSLPSTNITGLTYTTSLPSTNITGLTYTTTLPIGNITNLIGSQICSGTDKATNITITASGLAIVCTADIDTDTIITTLPSTNITGLTYTTSLPSTNITGLTYTTSLPATNITAGAYPSGTYYYPQNLNVTHNVTLERLCLNIACTSYIYNNGTHTIIR